MKGYALGIPRAALADWHRLQFALADATERHLRVPCRAGAPQDWEGETAEQVQYAVAQCGSCPVFGLCGTYAEAAKETVGIWAGRDRNKKPVGMPTEEQTELFELTVFKEISA